MNRFLYHKNYLLNYDLIEKFNCKNIFDIEKIEKIILNSGNKEIEKKNLIQIILLLELISSQKGFITKSRKNKIHLKIKKGSLVGCKITLRNNKIFNFLEKIILFYLPQKKDFKGINVKKTNLSFTVENPFLFNELSNEFFQFKKNKKFSITIVFKRKNHECSQNKILLNSFNFPILRK